MFNTKITKTELATPGVRCRKLHSSSDVNAESSKSTSGTFEHPEKWSWDIPSKNRTNGNPVIELKSETLANTHNFILTLTAVNITKYRTINRHRMRNYVALTAGLG